MSTLFFACAGPAAAHATMPPPAPRVVPLVDGAREHDALRRAQVHLRSGDYAGALAWLDAAAADAPDLPLAHVGRAVCLAQLGREDDAREALDAALRSPQADGGLALSLAGMCAQAGHAPLAMGLLEAAVEADPGLGERARDDPSFAGLRDHPRFLLIVGVL